MSLKVSETFLSHFYGQMPFVMECDDLISHQWTLEDGLLSRSELAEGAVEAPAARELRGALGEEAAHRADALPAMRSGELPRKGYSRFTHPAIGQAKGHSFMAADAAASCLSEESVRKGLESGTWVLSSGNSLSPKLAQICQGLQDAFEAGNQLP